MKVRAINLHTQEEHDSELSVGITGDKDYICIYNICIYNNTKTGKISAGEYINLEELYTEWEIISKPEIYENYTGKIDYPLLSEKYMELYQHVLSRFRERSLLKIGL